MTDVTTWFDQAECEDLARLLDRKFAGLRGPRYFAVEFSKDAQGVYAKVTLRNESGSYFYPVESRIAFADTDLSDRAAAMFLLDYMTEYFAEYFREDGDCYLPIDWTEYQWDGVAFQVKGQILNLELEKMADELLAGYGGGSELLN
ncbi:MAG: hypothetical protein FJ146_05765 [Deltaproteobacteria bacterium]|nr:hypothetical protein [Deltaproteobacteria bacterium]